MTCIVTLGWFDNANESIELCTHNGWATHKPMQYCLVEYYLKTYRRILHQKSLSRQPNLNEFVDPLAGELRDTSLMHGACVVRRLHQSRHDRGLVVLDSRRCCLQSHIGGEIVQVIALPPAGLLAFARECHQTVSFGLVGHVVEVTQVTDVPRSSGTVTSLHTAQLAHREHQSLSGLFDGEAHLQPKCSQQGA